MELFLALEWPLIAEQHPAEQSYTSGVPHLTPSRYVSKWMSWSPRGHRHQRCSEGLPTHGGGNEGDLGGPLAGPQNGFTALFSLGSAFYLSQSFIKKCSNHRKGRHWEK